MSKINFIPSYQKDDLKNALITALKKVTYRFWISSPFVTADGLDIIGEYKKGGVDYRLITRLNEEDIMNGLLDPRAIANFIEAGGKARYHDKHLHAKLWIADDNVFVGSANLTRAGLTNNIEFMVSISKFQMPGRSAPHKWFLYLWNYLEDTEKSPRDLHKIADSTDVKMGTKRIKSIGKMTELKDFGKPSKLMPSNEVRQRPRNVGWFKINGVNEDRIQPDFDLRVLSVYEGGQTVSKKGRPKWRDGDIVILSYLAIRDDAQNDYCIYGRGVVDVAHRPSIDEIPEWLKVGEVISREDYNTISRWPYIVWLRDIQIINGKAKDALWLSEINKLGRRPIIWTGSLIRKSYIKLEPRQLAVINDLLDSLFSIGAKPLYLAIPDQVWWNQMIKDQDYYVTKARLDAEAQ